MGYSTMDAIKIALEMVLKEKLTRELALTRTKLEEAMMWYACHELTVTKGSENESNTQEPSRD